MNATINLSGTWRVTGDQSNVPHSYFESELVLHPDGSFFYKVIEGANEGATRSGMWSFDGKTFTMNHSAPRVGLVEWESDHVTQTSIEGINRTPQAGPQPIGWGGKWHASRVSP